MPSFASILTLPAFRSLSVTLPLGQWIRVARERRMLAGLNEHQLRDIGIGAVDAADEVARPFWDLPKRRC